MDEQLASSNSQQADVALVNKMWLLEKISRHLSVEE